jgi:hypothetical protein
VAHLDAAGQFQGAAAVRGEVASAHLGGLDDAVPAEVAAGDEVVDVFSGLVGSGDPGGAADNAGINQVQKLGGAFAAQQGFVQREAGAEVALDDERLLLEVVTRLRSTARSPGTPMTTSWRSPVGSVTARTTFLRVSAAVHAPPSASLRGASSFDAVTRVSMVGVSGVSRTRAAGASLKSIPSGATVVTASRLAA